MLVLLLLGKKLNSVKKEILNIGDYKEKKLFALYCFFFFVKSHTPF